MRRRHERLAASALKAERTHPIDEEGMSPSCASFRNAICALSNARLGRSAGAAALELTEHGASSHFLLKPRRQPAAVCVAAWHTKEAVEDPCLVFGRDIGAGVHASRLQRRLCSGSRPSGYPCDRPVPASSSRSHHRHNQARSSPSRPPFSSPIAMNDLPSAIHANIKQFCADGDALAEQRLYKEAIKRQSRRTTRLGRWCQHRRPIGSPVPGSSPP